jgi:endonuclease I
MKKILSLLVALLFTFSLVACQNDTMKTDIDTIIVNNIAEEITFDSFTVEDDINLPNMVDGYIVTWLSSNPLIISDNGEVTRPSHEDGNQEITLTVTITSKDVSITKDYVFTVVALDQIIVDENGNNDDENNDESLNCNTGQHEENNTCVDDDSTVDYIGYYDGAEDLEGELLKAFLHDLIDNHTVISYGDLRDALQDSDEDPNNPNNIILLYSGDSINSAWDSGATWNREHVWPKSLGDFESDVAGSDMHHIRATYTTVNSVRGNKYFDMGGSLVSKTDDCYSDSDSFEPRDEVKGDIARMMFYMVVRYEGNDGANGADLELVSAKTTSTSGLLGNLELLIQWHLEDPVDDIERARNEVIFGYQHNRNPFIDHPEFVLLIWD